jgi:hypothetical protein
MLSKEAAKALRTWVRVPTWHKPNDFDYERFYEFIHALSVSHEGMINEAEVHQEILRAVKKAHPKKNHAPDEEYIRERMRVGVRIIDYLRYIRSRGA